MRLDGKVAIVTGAGCVGPGWGNGRATAVRFAREGATVIAVDLDPDSMEETARLAREDSDTEIERHVADVCDEAQVAELMGACTERHGRVDVLVNNVGGSAPGGPVEMDPAVWQGQFDYNVTSVYLMCRHVLPAMIAQGAGAIVNLGSTAGLSWSGHPHIAYAAAKAAIIQFTRVLAVQHAPDGIRVNAVIPGQLHTPMVEARLAGDRTGGDVEKLLAERNARIPLRVQGDGRDTAAAALFLASDDARFVTGTGIVVDGGMTARSD